MQAIFYDAQGNKITSQKQMTTVQDVHSLFYMSLHIKTSNVGTATLNNLRMTESHPIEFTQALQALQPESQYKTVLQQP